MRAPARPDAVVGVDLGIKALAVLSTGELVSNPRHLNKALKTLRRASRTLSRRRGPDRRTGQRPSARWETARRDVARIHTRVGNLRTDAIHKLTTDLAATYGTIVVEDLHVAGMLKNRNLARHLADASFGQIRRQLAYKTGWNGGQLAVADRWFPSSKTCSPLRPDETQTEPRGPNVHLRTLRPGPGPGPQRRDQPQVLRRPGVAGRR